jgi:uncharacterized damage-inducible protein DinB
MTAPPTTDLLTSIRRLWAHSIWADGLLFDALSGAYGHPAWAEYTHILGAEETWLSRLEKRAARAAVWPELNIDEAVKLRESVMAGFEKYLNTLDERSLDEAIEYTNSAGKTFQTAQFDILLHVALHGQYHRGKINVLLRQSGAEPVLVDYIGYVRGAAAAVTPR